MEFKEECVSQLTNTFGWPVKIKSIHQLQWGSICVGSNISLSKDVSASKCVPSAVVLSLLHEDEDLALKSARIMVKKGFIEAGLRRSSSKLNEIFQIRYCLASGTSTQHHYNFIFFLYIYNEHYNFPLQFHKET